MQAYVDETRWSEKEVCTATTCVDDRKILAQILILLGSQNGDAAGAVLDFVAWKELSGSKDTRLGL